MKERLALALLAMFSLSACNEDKNSGQTGGAGSGDGSSRTISVFGSIRPKATPEMIQQVEQEEREAARAKQAALEKSLADQAAAANAGYSDPSSRNLPAVNQDPIAGNGGGLPPVNPSTQPAQPDPSTWMGGMQQAQAPVPPAPPPPQQVAGYGINYQQPTGGGFVPPPPAVSISTTAQIAPYPGAPYGQDPYGGYNPYAGGYGAPPQAAAPPPANRPALFGSGNKKDDSANQDDDEPKKKKEKNFVPIVPTGMEARSPYKQRDDLKALWKGALASSLAPLARDEKFTDGLNKVDVNLPTESTKGSLSVAPRTIDGLFKNATVDKKVFEKVKKSENDLTQAYYRYLYSFNKFSLTQQQVAARKQEMDLAESNSEKQRATTDLAQAQSDADAARDDMRAAQSDLASSAGAAAARTVIGRVCGVAPSLESLQIAEQPQADAQAQQQTNNPLGGFFSAIGLGGGKPKTEAAAPEAVVAKADTKEKSKDKDKDKDNKKDKKNKKEEKGSKAPAQVAQAEEPASSKAPAAAEPAAVSPAASSAVQFELKNVTTTPRKSTLRVAIRNSGADSFNFDSDAISVSEGNAKLADAAVRAEFDTTVVQPNSEIQGTITIFGRPWNDKLTVSLSSDAGKAIPLHR